MPTKYKFLSLCLFLVAVVGVYWPSLHFAIFFDDLDFFKHARLHQLLSDGAQFQIRWLPYMLTALVNQLFDSNIFVQRGINLGLHIATALVLYGFVKQVSDHVSPHRHNERAALAAALLFLLHPLAAYAVGYLIQRTILMATLFGLLALMTYFEALVKRRKAYFLYSALFYLVAVFSKEQAILIPAVAILLTPLATPWTRQTWRQVILPFSLYLPIAVWVFIKSQSTLGRAYEPLAEHMLVLRAGAESHAMIWLLSMMTQAALYFKYLLLMLIPDPQWMSIDMRVPFASSVTQPKYLLGVVALLIYGAVALNLLLKSGRRSLIGFALLGPLLLFGVEFSTVRIQEPFVLYRAYLWLPLLFMLLPAVTNSISGRVFWALVLAVALAFSMALHNRLQSFNSAFALWDDAVKKLPSNTEIGVSRVYFNRGFEYLKRGDSHSAIPDLSQAIVADRGYKRAYVIRALAYYNVKNYELALRDIAMAMYFEPDDWHLYELRGAVYQGSGQGKLAQADFAYACKQGSATACAATTE